MNQFHTTKLRPIPLKAWIALGFSMGVIVAGWFLPVLGLAVPALLVLAIVSNFFRSRWFCAQACPRAGILSHFVARISRYRSLPRFLYSDPVRTAGCAFLMVCAVGQTMRLWPQVEAIGWFFWIVCLLTLALAVILGILFKPRSWCALCPVATLQSTLKSGGTHETATTR